MNELQIKPQIRWLIRRDMPEVLEIENACFEFIWTEENFLCCLRQRNCIGMVAEQNGGVVGFMIYELDKTSLRIINFAVHPVYWRQGIGTAMMNRMKQKIQRRRNEIHLEVRERNTAAQIFFRSQGLVVIDILKDWYDDTDEDAYQFSWLHLVEAEV